MLLIDAELRYMWKPVKMKHVVHAAWLRLFSGYCLACTSSVSEYRFKLSCRGSLPQAHPSRVSDHSRGRQFRGKPEYEVSKVGGGAQGQDGGQGRRRPRRRRRRGVRSARRRRWTVSFGLFFFSLLLDVFGFSFLFICFFFTKDSEGESGEDGEGKESSLRRSSPRKRGSMFIPH